ncbi:hypothetical protein [Maritimibacter dapengensis]|uniref:DUF4189 domain-containing protein n=1 Tax=Maritimibacter dapengensis TaxID=2836868 RepID=A0ABS6T5A5_9RHOB|nr:hypothetical protein [Maritimibacter dapengensis]MBV7379547.1 hypothetical protein [Maritimibacter dapengensis]
MRKAMTGLALAILTALPVAADPMNSDAARKQLFSAKDMILHPMGLDAFGNGMKRAVRLTLDQMKSRGQMLKFLEAGYGYYGAVAFPTNGNGEEPPTIISQLNSPGAAQQAAINACQSANGSTCAVAALLLPKGYSNRDLMLSQAATAKVVNQWDEGTLPKYLAFSPSTNSWGIAKGPGASARMAVESCKRSDCVVAIADQ